jgi:hypothetical protein
MYQDIQSNMAHLKTTPLVEPPKGLEKRILQALAASPEKEKADHPEKGPTWSQWLLSFRGMSLAAAAVLLIFIVQNAPKMVHQSQEMPPNKPLPAQEATKPVGDKVDKKELPKSEVATLPQPSISDSEMKGLLPPMNRSENLPSERLLGKTATTDAMAPVAEKAIQSKLRQNSLSETPLPQGASAQDTDNQLFTGYSSGINEPLEKVISNQRTWEEVWSRHQRNQGQKGSVPAVDFDKNEVIAVFAGNQPTAGFQVEFSRVSVTQWENAPARIVRYRVIGPPEGTMAATVLTQPFLMKVVPKINGPTFFKKIR